MRHVLLSLLVALLCPAASAQSPSGTLRFPNAELDHTLTVQFPAGTPNAATVRHNVHGSYGGVGGYGRALSVFKGTTGGRVLCYRPGYEVATAELDAAALAKDTLMMPALRKLPVQRITLRFATPDGKPVGGTRFVLLQNLMGHQFFGYIDGAVIQETLVTGVTDATGRCMFDLPRIDLDPFYATLRSSPIATGSNPYSSQRPVSLSLILPLQGLQRDPARDPTPNVISLPVKGSTVTVTVTPRARLRVRLPGEEIGAAVRRGNDAILNAGGRSTVTERGLSAEYEAGGLKGVYNFERGIDGGYSITLRPGSYEIVMRASDKDWKTQRWIARSEDGTGWKAYDTRRALVPGLVLRAGEVKEVDLGGGR